MFSHRCCCLLVIFSYFIWIVFVHLKKQTNKQQYVNIFVSKEEWGEETSWKHILNWKVQSPEQKSKSLRLYLSSKNCIRLEIIPIFPWPWQVSRKKLYNLESSNAGHVGIIQRLYLRNICCIHLFLRSTRIKIDILKRKKERKSMIVRNKLKLSEKKIHSIKF